MRLTITIPRAEAVTLTKSMAMEVNMFVGGIRGGGGDMIKSVYDPQGIEADAFDMDNMVEGENNKLLTSTEKSNLHAPGSDNQDLSGYALKEDVREAFPIGSIFLTVVNDDPKNILGYGNWVAFATGRMLLGVDQNDPNFTRVEQDGGTATITPSGTVSQPTFSGYVLGTHQHSAVSAGKPSGTLGAPNRTVLAGTGVSSAGDGSHSHTLSMDTMGTHQHAAISAGRPAGTVSQPSFAGDSINILNPYTTVYMWKRIADDK